MNWGSSTREGLFVDNVLCMLVLKEGGELVGDRTLMNDVVRERRRGEMRVLERFGNEKERVEGLRRWFGVELSGEEREGVRGTKTCLDR